MYVLTSLDDIAWLLNIRGNDIAYNPVVLSYVIVTEDKLYLFVNEEVLHGEAYPYIDNYHNIDMLKYLEDLGTEILPYDDIYKWQQILRDIRSLWRSSISIMLCITY